ncbi:MAG: NADH-quinone oxidoreductase subunit J [Elusimicrobia bacterium]|nr:NADH-quinone oxidoreductase subunit J [Elusimicrobiota bacterium]
MIQFAVIFFGAAAAMATLLMLFQRHPVKAAMLMLAALLSTACVYLALSAQMLAVLQMIIYAGAIMVLFTVAMAVMPAAWRDHPGRSPFRRVLGLAAAAVILTELMKVSSALAPFHGEFAFTETGVQGLAEMLFGRFTFQFELLSLVILAGIVAAVALAQKRREA